MIARITGAPAAVQAALPQADALPLREGSSVLVQVLRALGGGRYRVAIGGRQLDVSAHRLLQAGTSFSGTVRFDGDRILIEPREAGLVLHAGADEGNAAALLQEASVPLEEGSLARYLVALGLPPDSLSVRLLSFLRQNGLKISLSYMDRIRRAAQRFAGQESAAAEAMLLLDADGIAGSDGAVRAVLAQFYGGGHSGEGSAQSAGADSAEESGFLSRLYAAPVRNSPGMLTLLNHCAKENAHWIFLPYEFGETCGRIGLLLDRAGQRLKKIQVHAKNSVTERWFVVYYSSKDISEIRFWTEPQLGNAGAACAYLSELAGGLPVQYGREAVFSGACVQNEALAAAGGLA